MKKIYNLLLIIMVGFILSGCFTTISPKPIVSKVASYAGTNSNGGIIRTIIDEKGHVIYVIINKESHDNYNMLIKKYGKIILPELKKDDGITILPDGTFQIDGQHFADFSLMAQWYKEGK